MLLPPSRLHTALYEAAYKTMGGLYPEGTAMVRQGVLTYQSDRLTSLMMMVQVTFSIDLATVVSYQLTRHHFGCQEFIITTATTSHTLQTIWPYCPTFCDDLYQAIIAAGGHP